MDSRKEFFDRMAASWDERSAVDPAAVDAVLAHINIAPGDRVLDVGTGTGVLLPSLLRRVGPRGRIYALDYSEEMLKRAKAKNPSERITYLHASVYQIPLESYAVDAVVCFSTFPHFDDKRAAIVEMARVIRPWGTLLVGHAESREKIAALHRQVGGPVEGDVLPDPEEMKDMLADAGLQVEAMVDADIYVVSAAKSALLPWFDMSKSHFHAGEKVEIPLRIPGAKGSSVPPFGVAGAYAVSPSGRRESARLTSGESGDFTFSFTPAIEGLYQAVVEMNGAWGKPPESREFRHLAKAIIPIGHEAREGIETVAEVDLAPVEPPPYGPGQKVSLRATFRGQPLPGWPIAVVYLGPQKPPSTYCMGKTDGKGVLEYTFPLPGRYVTYLFCTVPRENLYDGEGGGEAATYVGLTLLVVAGVHA